MGVDGGGAAGSLLSVAFVLRLHAGGAPSRVFDLAFTPPVTVPITSADDGLKWRFRALYPEGAASRGACVSYMGTNHTS